MIVAAAPEWTESARNMATVAQAAAILVAGAWAYYKFVRGRTFKRRADMTVDAKLVQGADQKALSIDARFRNTGSVYIHFTPDEDAMRVARVWGTDALTPGRSPYWGDSLIAGELFLGHTGCEVGEMITDHLLLPLPPSPEPGRPWLAYRVVALVDSPNRTGTEKRPRPWTSTTFVMDALGDGRIGMSDKESP